MIQSTGLDQIWGLDNVFGLRNHCLYGQGAVSSQNLWWQVTETQLTG